MSCGDLLSIAMQGDFGKPRPALLIQVDQFSEHSRATVLPITRVLVSALLLRVAIQPSAEHHLQKPFHLMVDKAITVRRDELGPAFGRIDLEAMVEVGRCLAVFFEVDK